ncbi:MAG TPA: hypothetical protein VK905_04335, partial [Bacillota bacterium]|nr:hypothetical protein [Bacillota bacterium]
MSRQIDARLTELGLGREARYELPCGQHVPWRLSPAPFSLDDERRAVLSRFGGLMAKFYLAADCIYQSALTDPRTSFVADYLDAGKPTK